MKEKIIEKIFELISSVETFAYTEIPQVLKEIILYESFKCIFLSISFLSIALTAFYNCEFKNFIEFRKKDMSDYWSPDSLFIFWKNGALFLVGSVALILFLVFFSEFLKAWCAPRLYLLDYLKNMIKN